MDKANEWLQGVLELTDDQFEDAKGKAVGSIFKLMGDAPSFDHKRKTVRDLITENPLIAIVFVAAFIVSTFEIFKTVGFFMAGDVSSATYIGVPIDPYVQAVTIQIALVFLGEFSLITLMMRWRRWVKKTSKKGWSQFTHIYFALTLLVVAFIYFANFFAGFNILVSFMVPSVTLGLGWVFEEIKSDADVEYELAFEKYEKDKKDWEERTEDPEKHPRYKEKLVVHIWERIKSKNKRRNVELDVPKSFKGLAVQRELEKGLWAEQFLKNQSNYVIERKGGKSDSEDALRGLRAKMEEWTKNDPVLIDSDDGSFGVDMKKLIFYDRVENTKTKAKSMRALKAKVTYKMKGDNDVQTDKAGHQTTTGKTDSSQGKGKQAHETGRSTGR